MTTTPGYTELLRAVNDARDTFVEHRIFIDWILVRAAELSSQTQTREESLRELAEDYGDELAAQSVERTPGPCNETGCPYCTGPMIESAERASPEKDGGEQPVAWMNTSRTHVITPEARERITRCFPWGADSYVVPLYTAQPLRASPAKDDSVTVYGVRVGHVGNDGMVTLHSWRANDNEEVTSTQHNVREGDTVIVHSQPLSASPAKDGGEQPLPYRPEYEPCAAMVPGPNPGTMHVPPLASQMPEEISISFGGSTHTMPAEEWLKRARAFLKDEGSQMRPQSAVQGWQPIETAPKDDTEILVFVIDLGWRPAYWTCGWDQPAWVSPVNEDVYADAEVTHWMPLPDAPQPPQGEGYD